MTPRTPIACFDLDWNALERLRAAFLNGTAGTGDYWRSDRDLHSYDQTFGRRIAWKWTHVLSELQRRPWIPPVGTVLDWGCGTGVAARQFLAAFPASATELVLWDRSALAREFAARLSHEQFPGRTVRAGLVRGPAVLLLSHVLTELTENALGEVLELADTAEAILWVEPGTRDVSRRLISVRERLRPRFHPVAPCTHAHECGLLVPANDRHWCHHFAASPPDVFTSSFWTRFARFAGIDLRSLPLSYLVVDQRPPPPLPPDAVRLLGRPRVYKAHALLFGCDAQGVCERELTRRQLPETFRIVRKNRLDSLLCWTHDQGAIARLQPVQADSAHQTPTIPVRPNPT